MPRKVRGIRLHGAGFQTYCRVNGEYRSATWPRDTPVSEMTTWLRDQRAQKTQLPKTARGTFEADARAYLEKVEALPTYTQRVTHLELWAAVFRGRRRSTITSAEIRAQRERWLLEGLAPHTVNLRLRALSNLWTVLDGRRAPNPVRDVPEATEPDPEPRSLPYWLAQRIADRFNRQAPRNRAIVELMITTGLTPVEISRLQPAHWRQQALFVQGRRKGQGGASRSIPLSDAAMRALGAFAAAQGWGKMPNRHFYRQFHQAARAVARDPLTIDDGLRAHLRAVKPYDLRHTFATQLYASSGDAHAAAHLLGHRSTSTTRRYIEAALELRAAKAVQQLVQDVASDPCQPPQVMRKT